MKQLMKRPGSFPEVLAHRSTIETEEVIGTDERNEPITDWVPVAENIPCRIESNFTDEQVDGRNVVRKRYRGYYKVGAPLTPYVRVKWLNFDHIFKVDGEPWVEYDREKPHHIEVWLEEWK